MKRVLLKLSGEALAGEKKTGFDEATVTAVAKQVKEIVANTLKVKPTKHLEEQDITDSGVVINALTSAGLWTICGGARCSAA